MNQKGISVISMETRENYNAIRAIRVNKEQFENINKNAEVIFITCVEDGRIIPYTRGILTEDKENRGKVDSLSILFQKLDILKARKPDTMIIIESPNGSASVRIGDALIYAGINNEVVIDAEG